MLSIARGKVFHRMEIINLPEYWENFVNRLEDMLLSV